MLGIYLQRSWLVLTTSATCLIPLFSILIIALHFLCIGFVLFELFLFLGGKLAHVFTNSVPVANAMGELSPLLASSILLNGFQPVLSGVAIGAGRQRIVAFVNLICYYLKGISIGIVLGYVSNLHVKGVWIGMLLGTFVQTVALVIITCKTDWDKQVDIARTRVNRWAVPESEEQNNQNA